MLVCVYMHACVYVNVRKNTYLDTCRIQPPKTLTYTHVYVNICVHIYVYVYVYAYISLHARIHI